MKPRDHVGRSVHDDARLMKIDASDEPPSHSNFRRPVIDFQFGSGKTFDRGEDGFNGSHHRELGDWSQCIAAASGGATGGARTLGDQLMVDRICDGRIRAEHSLVTTA